MRRSLWAWFLLAGAVSAVSYATAPQQTIQELWWQVVTFGSAGAVLVGLRAHAPASRRPWRLLCGALGVFALMGLLGASFWGWPADHGVWQLRDLGLVAGFVGLGVATLALVRARAPDGDPEGVVDGFIVMLALAAVLWDNVFGPLARGDIGLATQIRFVVFPLLQAGITAVALRLLFLGTTRLPSAWLVFAAATTTCVANVVWVLLGGGEPGQLVNLLWVASFLLAGTAALHPTMRDLVRPAAALASRLPLGRLAVLGLALVSLPATVLRYGISTPDGPPMSAAAAMLCVGLVLWRLGRLVQQRERASAALERRAARESALARLSGEALLRSDPEALLVDAAESVRTTLEAADCAVVRGIVDEAAATAHERTVVPLTDWVSGPAALVIDLRHGQRLDAGEQEFVQAMTNVLVGALRRWTVEQEMRHQTLHDPLTELPNRILLLDRLDQALARSERDNRAVSVVFVDLDGFKRINDTLGHNAGDELLVAVAGRLVGISRPQDTVARISGDEFVMVCDETDGAGAARLANRMIRSLSEPFELAAGTAVVGASVGIASATGHDATAEQVLRDADAAMYRAKQAGRGRVELFDDDLRHQLSRLDELERDLTDAHERGELRLVYQPILALEPERLRTVGAEALLRWQHPREGFVLPETFIGVAEARGLIVPLGDWVTGQACRQAAAWRSGLADDVPLTVSINVSPRQLAEADFVERFQRLLLDSGARSRDLLVEVTETAVTADVAEGARLEQALIDLRALGVRVALDDFGTGYSSLTHLRKLPLDVLKVDGSFVQGLGEGGREHAIVSAIAGLSQELGVAVLAEGVETPEQLIAVRALGFDLAQGFHLGRPGSAEDVARMLGVEAAHRRTRA